MLVGSFSSNFYGIPRATKDADLMIQISHEQRRSFLAKLPTEMKVDPQMTFETATATTKTLIYGESIGFEIELFDLSDDLNRFARRTLVSYMDQMFYLPTAEDMILQKMRWYKKAFRGKDLEDAQSVYLVQKAYLNWNYIMRWAKQHGTFVEMQALQRS
jgi:hypothetical protein